MNVKLCPLPQIDGKPHAGSYLFKIAISGYCDRLSSVPKWRGGGEEFQSFSENQADTVYLCKKENLDDKPELGAETKRFRARVTQ